MSITSFSYSISGWVCKCSLNCSCIVLRAEEASLNKRSAWLRRLRMSCSCAELICMSAVRSDAWKSVWAFNQFWICSSICCWWCAVCWYWCLSWSSTCFCCSKCCLVCSKRCLASWYAVCWCWRLASCSINHSCGLMSVRPVICWMSDTAFSLFCWPLSVISWRFWSISSICLTICSRLAVNILSSCCCCSKRCENCSCCSSCLARASKIAQVCLAVWLLACCHACCSVSDKHSTICWTCCCHCCAVLSKLSLRWIVWTSWLCCLMAWVKRTFSESNELMAVCVACLSSLSVCKICSGAWLSSMCNWLRLNPCSSSCCKCVCFTCSWARYFWTCSSSARHWVSTCCWVCHALNLVCSSAIACCSCCCCKSNKALETALSSTR